MDLQSLLGYASNSPFRNNPYLDINTPEGLITMENTPIDLLGIDNLGNTKKMKAGKKNPYKFPGTQVREIPMQTGGKPPIYTSNPRDPRIQAYKDSMNVYNADQRYQQAEDKWALAEYNLWNQTAQNYDGRTDDYSQNKGPWKDLRAAREKEVNTLDSLTSVAVDKSTVPNEPNEEVHGYNFRAVYNRQKKGFDTFLNSTRAGFKHPVQPVIYKAPPERKPNMSGPPIPIPTERVNIDQAPVNIPNIPYKEIPRAEYDNTKPTKYSFTYPTGEGQKSIYFPNKSSLQEFIKSTRNASSQEGEDYMTATGYLKKGGYNPYQRGGLTNKQMFDFLFDDDDPEEPVKGQTPPPTAPTTDEVDIQSQMADMEMQKRQLANQENDNLAMQIMMQSAGNPYSVGMDQQQSVGNPYQGEIKSSGKYGAQGIGQRGRQIYGQLAYDLGYTPTVNSIFRSKEQNDALIAAGAPAARNSYHLTGDAIDLKPEDWHRLSNEQQLAYRQNYDVVYHNNHYHIEPKQ